MVDMTTAIDKMSVKIRYGVPTYFFLFMLEPYGTTEAPSFSLREQSLRRVRPHLAIALSILDAS